MTMNFSHMSLAEKTIILCNILEKFKEGINEAIRRGHGQITYDDVVSRVLTGQYHIYPMPNSLMIMELVSGDYTNAYHGIIACGDLDEIASQHDTINSVASELNCSKLVITGRPGWAKAFRKYGWTQTQVIIERPVIPTDMED